MQQRRPAAGSGAASATAQRLLNGTRGRLRSPWPARGLLAAFAAVWLLAGWRYLAVTRHRVDHPRTPLLGGEGKGAVALRGDTNQPAGHGGLSGKRGDEWRESDLNRCGWIQGLLSRKDELALGDKLPEPGITRDDGATFWIKRPVLHAIDPESGKELMVLMYNVYNKDPSWTQHTDKFTNTVKVLLHENGESDIFPKLLGFCPDIDGFHYIAVEYIAYDVNRLPKPNSLETCVDRASKAIELFVKLDEEMHMVLTDFKPGQWMVRANLDLVLQDVDDILPSGSLSPYPEQVEWHQGRVGAKTHLDRLQVDKLWNTIWFPRGQLNIRYMVLNTELLLDNLGFRWSSDCNATPSFLACKKKLLDWTYATDDTWPSPIQIWEALQSCYHDSSFRKTTRKPAVWRDFDPMPASEWKPKTVCKRTYDKPHEGATVTRCQHSCCRSKGGDKCYYTAPDNECS